MSLSRPTRVLCVEDDDIIRSNAVEALKDAGFEVLEAGDSGRAMDLIRDPDSIDVLFTDVVMPGQCDGVDLVEQIRLDHPSMPVIVTSGYAHRLSARLTKLSPPTVFVSKPYQLAEIVKTLEKITADAG